MESCDIEHSWGLFVLNAEDIYFQFLVIEIQIKNSWESWKWADQGPVLKLVKYMFFFCISWLNSNKWVSWKMLSLDAFISQHQSAFPILHWKNPLTPHLLNWFLPINLNTVLHSWYLLFHSLLLLANRQYKLDLMIVRKNCTLFLNCSCSTHNLPSEVAF